MTKETHSKITLAGVTYKRNVQTDDSSVYHDHLVYIVYLAGDSSAGYSVYADTNYYSDQEFYYSDQALQPKAPSWKIIEDCNKPRGSRLLKEGETVPRAVFNDAEGYLKRYHIESKWLSNRIIKGLKRLGRFTLRQLRQPHFILYKLVDFLVGFVLGVGITVALTPFYEMAHLTHQLIEHNKGRGVVKGTFYTLYYVLLRMPLQVALITFLSIFEGMYRWIRGVTRGFPGKQHATKGFYIFKGAFSGALMLPWNNLNWGAEGENADSYYFGVRDLVVLALFVGCVLGIVGAVIVSSGVAAPIVSAIVNFVITHTGINLAVWTLPQLSAASFFVVGLAGALATGVIEVGIYVATRVMDLVGRVINAIDGLKYGRHNPKVNKYRDLSAKRVYGYEKGPETVFYKGLYEMVGITSDSDRKHLQSKDDYENSENAQYRST